MIRIKIDSKKKRVTLLEVKLGSLKEVKSIVQQLDPDGWQEWVVESEVEYVSQPTYPWVAPTFPFYSTTTERGSDFDTDIKNQKN